MWEIQCFNGEKILLHLAQFGLVTLSHDYHHSYCGSAGYDIIIYTVYGDVIYMTSYTCCFVMVLYNNSWFLQCYFFIGIMLLQCSTILLLKTLV